MGFEQPDFHPSDWVEETRRQHQEQVEQQQKESDTDGE